MNDATSGTPPGRTGAPSAFTDIAAILVMFNLGVAQPLLDLLGRNAEFFVAHDSQPLDLVLLALGLTVLAPGLLAGAVRLLRVFAPRVGALVHAAVLGALSATFVLYVAKRAINPGIVLAFSLALMGAALVVFLYRQRVGIQAWFRFLAPLPVLIAVMFLFLSPASRLVFPARVAAAEGVTVGEAAPIVMLVFDEFPVASLLTDSYEIDRQSFPNFARLAEMSTWYRNTTTVSGYTGSAVPAILDGQMPEKGKLPTAEDHPNTLFTLLADAYDIRTTSAVTKLCPQSICREHGPRPPRESRVRALASDIWVVYRHQVLPESLTRSLPAIDQGWNNFGALGAATSEPTTTRAFDPWGDRQQLLHDFVTTDLGRPRSFNYLHVLLPHVPWQYLPDGRQYSNAGEVIGLTDEVWGPDEWAIAQGMQRHLLQLQLVDREIGELLDNLERSGRLDETLLVVTADHGVNFTTSSKRRTATSETLGGIAHIPLFVKTPEQPSGEVVDDPMQTTDIVGLVSSALDLRAEDLTVPSGSTGSSRQRTISFGDLVFELPDDMRLARDAVTLKSSLFGFPPREDAGFFAIGPYRGLTGRPVDELAQTAGAGSVRIDRQELYADVDPTSTVLPSFLTGTVDVDDTDEVHLAIAVNGTIAGVTKTFGEIDASQFSALLLSSAFRSGANDIAVFRIFGPPSNPVLDPLSRENATTYAIGASTVTEEGTGRSWRLEAEAVPGKVRVGYGDGKALRVSGWAVDLAAASPAERVLVFVNGTLLYNGPPGAARKDVVELLGDERYRRSGFDVIVPFPSDLTPSSVTAFALSGTRGSPMTVTIDPDVLADIAPETTSTSDE